MTNKIGYVPALDGLRAIAIILVMLAHANFQLGANGILGVDMFFALSGFLITTLLLEEYEINNTISLAGFYIRRTFRLFPALYILLIVIFCYVLLFTNSMVEKVSIINEIKAASLYLYNISWQWGWGSEGLLLGHTWSLAVEEQFYMFWPLLLITALKLRILKQFGIGLFIFILFIFLLKTGGQISPLGNALIHESIFIGCFAALLRWHNYLKINLHFIIPFSLLLFTILIGVFPMPWYMELFKQGGRSLLAVITVIIILNLVKNPSSITSKILSLPILVFIGKISYALYLWHVPIFRWFKWHSTLLPWQTFVLKILLTFLISTASFILIENRSTKFGRNLSKKIVLKLKP